MPAAAAPGPRPPAIHRLMREMEMCRKSPVRFFERWLGIKTLYDKQVEVLESVRDNKRTLTAACHSSGKTFLAGGIFWWFETCFPISICVTTAPTDRQVKDLLWGEIRARHGGARIPLAGEPTTQNWHMPDPPGRTGLNAKWYGTGFATTPDQADENASKFIGYHSDHVLVMFDEASGIIRPIWKAAEGLFASGKMVRFLGIGNPLDPASTFASYYRDPGYNSIRISAFDTPNFRLDLPDNEHLVSKEWVDDQRRMEGEDSPLYVSKVLGKFPEYGDDTMIPIFWVSSAFERLFDPTGEQGEISMGVDVARFGTDAIAFYVVHGDRIIHSEAAFVKPVTWTAGKAIELAERFGIRKSTAFRIGVDDTGVGGGVVDVMHDHGWEVNGVDFGSKAIDEGRFHDRRTELWWTLREWIQTACLEDAPYRARRRLEGDLSTPKYTFKQSRRCLEQKDQMKKRLGRSPDDGDALALALAYLSSAKVAFPVEPVDVDGRDEESDRPTGVTVGLGLGNRSVTEEYMDDHERYHGSPYD